MRSSEILKRTAEGMREGNKILVQELVRDLEEKGISPVIAVEGKVRNLKLAAKSKFLGFEKELKKSGLEKSDFCLLQEAKTRSLNIFVVQKTSGKVRIYKDSHWIDDFHHDVETRFFN